MKKFWISAVAAMAVAALAVGTAYAGCCSGCGKDKKGSTNDTEKAKSATISAFSWDLANCGGCSKGKCKGKESSTNDTESAKSA